MGQVCRKHEEFYEEACRWCEPAKAVEVPAAPPIPTSAQWGGNLNNSAYAQQNATAANAAACPTGFGVYSYMLCTFGGCMAPAAYGCKTCGVAGCANHPGIPHSPLRHMSPGRI